MAIERTVYVLVGATDVAVERVLTLPVVRELRRGFLLEQARELEPKARKQVDELQQRGEEAVVELRRRGRSANERIRELPDDARKQARDLGGDARRQLQEAQARVERAWGQVSRTGGEPSPRRTAGASSTRR